MGRTARGYKRVVDDSEHDIEGQLLHEDNSTHLSEDDGQCAPSHSVNACASQGAKVSHETAPDQKGKRRATTEEVCLLSDEHAAHHQHDQGYPASRVPGSSSSQSSSNADNNNLSQHTEIGGTAGNERGLAQQVSVEPADQNQNIERGGDEESQELIGCEDHRSSDNDDKSGEDDGSVLQPQDPAMAAFPVNIVVETPDGQLCMGVDIEKQRREREEMAERERQANEELVERFALDALSDDHGFGSVAISMEAADTYQRLKRRRSFIVLLTIEFLYLAFVLFEFMQGSHKGGPSFRGGPSTNLILSCLMALDAIGIAGASQGNVRLMSVFVVGAGLVSTVAMFSLQGLYLLIQLFITVISVQVRVDIIVLRHRFQTFTDEQADSYETVYENSMRAHGAMI